MTTYVMRGGKLVEKAKASPRAGIHIWSDLPGYASPLDDGKWIEGRAARREHLKANGCIEAGDSNFLSRRGYINPHFALKRGLPVRE